MIKVGEGLGETLRKNRKLRNISQEQLAEAIDVTRQTISNWETGAAVPSANRLQQLSAVLGISAAELLGGEARPAADEEVEPAADPEPAPAAHRRWPLALLCAGVVCALLIGIAALTGVHSIKQQLEPDNVVPAEEIEWKEVDKIPTVSVTLHP